MKYLQLPLGYVLCLAFFATAGCKPKPKNQIVGEPPAGQPTSSPVVSSPVQSPSLSPSSTQASQIKAEQSPSLELSRLENSVRPSVIWVTVFDSSGKLLRTQTGFFISADGRLVTTAHAIEGGINAVAKTADGGIYNVSGILAASTALDLAILQADVKQKPFLVLNKNLNLPIGTPVGVVGSGLAGNEGSPREATISTQQSNRFEIGAAISPNAIGSPIVDANAEVVGVAVSAGEKATVRPSNSLESLLSQIASNATPRWPQTAQTSPSPSPRPTPKPRLVYAPAPSFPPDASRPGVSGSGRFRLTFDARGNVRNVEIVQSTGNALFDQAATKTLRQWKCTPGQEWVATVPITFQSR
jgi:TonB family protein